MRARFVVLCSIAVAILGALVFTLRATGLAHAAEATPGAPHPGPNDQAVVVELFTSEGCSSCPAADEVLARFERTQPVHGVRVVPLAFHVDYWDELGWPDAFASASFTARQGTYATQDRMYTPQAVVDGKTELVGSDVGALRRALEQAARQPHAPIGIVVRTKGGTIDADVHVGQLPAGATDGATFTVFVALTQAHATVRVLRGENAGRALQHTAIVRALQKAGVLDARGGDVQARFRIPSGVQAAELRVVAFAQRGGDHAIVGSTEGQLGPGGAP
jgi:hypothetical protein